MKKLNALKSIFNHIILYFFLVMMNSVSAGAQLTIDITKGNIDPTPVAVPNFLAASAELSQLGGDMASCYKKQFATIWTFCVFKPRRFFRDPSKYRLSA
jgi:TolB protein